MGPHAHVYIRPLACPIPFNSCGPSSLTWLTADELGSERDPSRVSAKPGADEQAPPPPAAWLAHRVGGLNFRAGLVVLDGEHKEPVRKAANLNGCLQQQRGAMPKRKLLH